MAENQHQNHPTGESWPYERQHVRAEVHRNAADIVKLRDDLIEKIEVVQRGLRADDESTRHALDRLKDDVNAKFTIVQVDIAALKVKASLWGGLAGAMVAVGGALIAYFKR